MWARPRRSALPAALLALLLVTGCSSSPASEVLASRTPTPTRSAAPAAAPLPVPSAAQLAGYWNVISLPLEPRAVNPRMGFRFEDTPSGLTVRASDGCNSHFGGLSVSDDGVVRLGDLSSTLKACGPESYDGGHLEALGSARSVGLDQRSGLDQLVLRDAHQRIVLVLQRIPPLSIGALLGSWRVVSLSDGEAPRRPTTARFALAGGSGSLVTDDGCRAATASVTFTGQFGVRFGAPSVTSGRCPAAGSDGLVGSLARVRAAGPDPVGDPDQLMLLTGGGRPVALLERTG